jgi:DNA-binding NarL/FixJ family response regulator
MNERDEKILALYHQGKMIKDIAAAVGMAPNSMPAILRRLGIERPTKPQKRWRGKPDQKQKIRELWDQGLHAIEIAERLSIERGTVDGILSALKIRDPSQHRIQYSTAAGGGSGRHGFRGNMARRT